MKRISNFLTCLALAAAFPTALIADDKTETATAKVNLSQFTFGKTISGSEVTADSLKGSPVIVEFWGVNCGPCLAAMPMFNSLAKRYDSKGLKIVGVESQNSSEEEVLGIVKKLKLKFPITAQGSHPLKFDGIPHSAIFAADGTLIYEGGPHDKGFDRALKNAMKTAVPAKEESAAPDSKTNAPLVHDRTWTNADGKPLAAALIQVKNGLGTFRRKDGSSFTYAIDKLSASDQEIITKAQAPPATP